MGKRGPKAWKPTKTELKMIQRMGKAGMKMTTVATALGRSYRSIVRNEEANSTFSKAITESITKVGESAIQRVLSGDADTALYAFILKTRGHWKESEVFITLDDLDDENKELELRDRLRLIDKMFADGKISISNYKTLSDTLSNRLKVDMVIDDVQKRVEKLEQRARLN